ncbi:MAG: hypothetical protein ACR2K5_15375 [Pseudolabrys sp.]
MQALGAPPESRLFACDGSPFDCPLFIIGLNPAVYTGRDFWNGYWSDHTGFKKELLLDDLLEAEGALTTTRANIEEIGRIARLGTLDANLYLHVSSRFHQSHEKQHRPDVIDQLILTLKPKVVLAHSVKAIRHLAQTSDDLVEEPLAIQSVCWNGLPLIVILSRHLGYVKGRAELQQICAAIVTAFGQAPRRK